MVEPSIVRATNRLNRDAAANAEMMNGAQGSILIPLTRDNPNAVEFFDGPSLMSSFLDS